VTDTIGFMPTARSDDALLAQLSAPDYDPKKPESVATLRQAIRKSSHHVVAKAAELVAKARLVELATDLVAAFDRFLIDPVKSDKVCIGKIAILDALNELDFQPPEIFLSGVRYVQMEPAYGGKSDTAGPVRCRCATALVRIDHPQALELLVDLLLDSIPAVRIAAVQGIGAYGPPIASLLLRLKARLGDEKPDVTAECLTEMIRVQPIEAIRFAAEFLESPDEDVVTAALLALGNSRRLEAFPVLKSYFDSAPALDLIEPTLVAMALLRQPVATEFLFRQLREARLEVAKLALSALAILAYDRRVREECESTVEARGDKSLRDLFRTQYQNDG
jgi:HEAT repeat protein